MQEVLVPVYVEVVEPAPPKPALFAHVADDVLLGYGVPEEWLDEVRTGFQPPPAGRSKRAAGVAHSAAGCRPVQGLAVAGSSL